jgi:hypothetical protein
MFKGKALLVLAGFAQRKGNVYLHQHGGAMRAPTSGMNISNLLARRAGPPAQETTRTFGPYA